MIKRLFFFGLLAFILSFPLSASNQYSFEADGIYYTIYNTSQVKVSSGPFDGSYSGRIVIPAKVSNNGITYTVTVIESSAFFGCCDLTAISIPGSVTSIEDDAFTGCSGLKELKLEDGSEILSFGVKRPYNYYREQAIFNDCPLETVYLGRNMNYPTDYRSRYSDYDPSLLSPFRGHGEMTSLTIGAPVTYLRQLDFYGCGALESIVIYSYKIEGIESCGLWRTTPVIIKSDSDFAGLGNTNLTYFDNIIVESGEHRYGLVKATHRLEFSDCFYSEGDLYLLPLEKCVAKAKNVKAVFNSKDITDELTSDKGFEFTPSICHAQNLFSIYGSDDDPSLTKSVSLSEAGTLFDSLGFQDIEKIEVLKISGDINGTDVMVINRMASLKYLDISEANIVEGGSTYRENLKTENNVVGTHFFDGIELEAVMLPNTATSIGARAFENSEKLKIIRLSDSLVTIGYCAFYGCSGLVSVIIPDSVNTIESSAFQACDNLKDITIGKNVTCIGSSVFRDCTSLTSVIIPDSVNQFGSDVFKDCKSLTSVRISNSLSKISSYTFSGCSSLSDITIPQSINSIGYAAFYDCSSLVALTIPSSVSQIEGSAFNGCKSLTSVTIPNSINIVDSDVFRNCRSLVSITIPNSVTSIRSSAFCSCSSLKSVTIPNSVTTIEGQAFMETALTEIIIPESVMTIGENAFARIPELMKVCSLNPTPPVIYPYTFSSNTLESATLCVQKGSLVLYWADPVWKEFSSITDNMLCLQPIPDVRYGDAEIDLTQYAPEGVELTYETSDNDVIRINGTKMQIVGAGTATVVAMHSDSGTQTELMGQMRQVVVSQADLTVTVADITVEEGKPLPEFTYIAEGLKYDDTVDDIDSLPVAICDVNENTPVGVYTVTFNGGYDRNYRITTRPAKITVISSSGVDNVTVDYAEPVEIYNLEGVLVYRGMRSEAHLVRGIYIIRQGNVTTKIYVD